VDASPLTRKAQCCMTIKESQRIFGTYFVRSISVVVDQGSHNPPANYRVNLREATVNGIRATQSLVTVDPEGYKDLAYLPEHGRSILVSNPNEGLRTLPLIIGDKDIKNLDSRLQAKLPVDSLRSKGTHLVNLCLFGGRCVPMQGSFSVPDAEQK
jgi:hypothetical protein